MVKISVIQEMKTGLKGQKGRETVMSIAVPGFRVYFATFCIVNSITEIYLIFWVKKIKDRKNFV